MRAYLLRAILVQFATLAANWLHSFARIPQFRPPYAVNLAQSVPSSFCMQFIYVYTHKYFQWVVITPAGSLDVGTFRAR